MQPVQNPRSQALTAPSSPNPPQLHAHASSNAQSDSSKSYLAILIASTPKLNRKSSGCSIGLSCKSNSNGDWTSATGESNISLTQKYDMCQKVAIGRGATSVIRLTQKWDKTEEKLYAVKVSPACSCLSPPFPRYYSMGPSMLITLPSSLRNSGSIARSRVLHLLHIASCQHCQDHWSCPGWEQGMVQGHGVLPWWGPICNNQERGHVAKRSRVLFQANIDRSVVFAQSGCHT